MWGGGKEKPRNKEKGAVRKRERKRKKKERERERKKEGEKEYFNLVNRLTFMVVHIQLEVFKDQQLTSQI